MKFFVTLCNIPALSLFWSLDDVDQKATKKLFYSFNTIYIFLLLKIFLFISA